MAVMTRADGYAGALLEVDLEAIVANWKLLQSLHRGGDVAAVVKADAYGSGASHVAPCLHRAGCRHFFTATLDEALALRPIVPGAMIAVLGGISGNAAEFRAADITPVLGTLAEIDSWRGTGGGVAVLHIDTGMNRTGLDTMELATLQREPSRLAGITPAYIMTHLVSAERRADPLNREQLARFASACAGLPPAPRSLANSSGVFLGPAYASDLARPGAALYGLNPTPDEANPMRPVLRLRARVLQVREVKPGETVGYNATWQAAVPARIATAAIGYADGWLRSQSNRGAAIFDGESLPLVGRVSMDLTTFDVTGEPRVAPGAWLELIGPSRPAEAAAEAAGTNAYEVLTALSPRIRRIYCGV
jgi:alanine racemase